MPELPEVQTIVDELKEKITGLKITGVWVDREKTVRQAGGIAKFAKEVKGKKVLNVKRRAKYIIINIEGPKTIFVHQKISGHLLYGKWEEKEGTWASKLSGPLRDDNRNKYIRAILSFNNGYQMALSDLRRFAKIILVDDKDLPELKEIRELGPEPLELDFKKFKELFGKKKGRIKQVLMDPTFIAGIGNIYSDEILWEAGIHPMSRTENLKEKDLKNIFTATGKILKQAIKYQGDSMDDFRKITGERGRYQEIQKAYHETGNKCQKKDGGIIERLKIGGRSAHFCPKHQILK